MRRNICFGAVDVHYERHGGARAALVTSIVPTFSLPGSEYIAHIAQVAPYEPGFLYKRELPCIRTVLARTTGLDLLIIDGYATLDENGRPGLGAHAAEELGIPVIGVAKTFFRTATHAAAVVRGAATRPLYVTSVGVEISDAADIVRAMAGPHRIPDALARVDRLARGHVQPTM